MKSLTALPAVPGRAYTYAPDTGDAAIRDEMNCVLVVARPIRA